MIATRCDWPDCSSPAAASVHAPIVGKRYDGTGGVRPGWSDACPDHLWQTRREMGHGHLVTEASQ